VPWNVNAGEDEVEELGDEEDVAQRRRDGEAEIDPTTMRIGRSGLLCTTSVGRPTSW
jgi:hypothetical protein